MADLKARDEASGMLLAKLRGDRIHAGLKEIADDLRLLRECPPATDYGLALILSYVEDLLIYLQEFDGQVI